jgi:hypothetical protein
MMTDELTTLNPVFLEGEDLDTDYLDVETDEEDPALDDEDTDGDATEE